MLLHAYSVCHLVNLIYVLKFNWLFFRILSFSTVAQVTQWGLILHGTEEPAQPNDPKSFDFPQPDANLFGEIDQNLDFDQTETGQWRTLHQVN